MGSTSRAFVWVAAALAVGPILAQEQQAPTFRSGTKVVSLYATVTETGRLVPGLTREEFEILDNDKPQKLTVFSNEVLPITVIVMLDTSGSMTGNIEMLKAGAEQFFLRLLRGDRGRVGDFNDKIQMVSPLTGDRDELISSLRDVDFGYPTRLYDAIAAGLDELKGIEGRKVVLVFTDGDDTASRTRFGTVLDRAQTEEVMVYAIGLQGDDVINGMHVRTRPDRSLKRLAEATGGGYFELSKTDQLTSTFTRVALELHSQYLLGFSPEIRDGKTHKLEVRINKPGMTVRARKTYVAS
ncbi:MAG TPA: VWA domain-containing protein [Vicinamibacterales bacterium]|jgi:Ca-activated chloride channel family protein